MVELQKIQTQPQLDRLLSFMHTNEGTFTNVFDDVYASVDSYTWNFVDVFFHFSWRYERFTSTRSIGNADDRQISLSFGDSRECWICNLCKIPFSIEFVFNLPW